jgi:hypothetical protein
VYAILLGDVKGNSVTINAISAAPGSKVYLSGEEKPLMWSQDGADVKIALPHALAGKYAYAVRIEGPVS